MCLGGLNTDIGPGRSCLGVPAHPVSCVCSQSRPVASPLPKSPGPVAIRSILVAVNPDGFGTPGTTFAEELLFLPSCFPGICWAAVFHALFTKLSSLGRSRGCASRGLGFLRGRGVTEGSGS